MAILFVPSIILLAALLALNDVLVVAWSTAAPRSTKWISNRCIAGSCRGSWTRSGSTDSSVAVALSVVTLSLSSNPNDWKGDIVSNDPEGKINGCSIQNVGDSVTDWIITIDGVEADLGKFSQAIYKKVSNDAKQQRFQGFRPGTIPPHLEPTYRAFAMDECARETVLEAMQQNNIRPFQDARSEFELQDFWIPPLSSGRKKKKNKKSKRKQAQQLENEQGQEQEKDEPQWRYFESMKEAVDAGWKPGQSFSFVAKNVKGQQVKNQSDVQGASPLGLNY